MDKQEKFDKIFLNIAKEISKASYCTRKKTGAIITKDFRIISIGYNGTLSNLNNNCEEIIDGKLVTNDFVIHAEQNAISFAAKEGISIKDCTIYITMSPCKMCAKLIASTGIKRVIYSEKYRNTEGIEYLKKCGIEIKQK